MGSHGAGEDKWQACVCEDGEMMRYGSGDFDAREMKQGN